MSSCRPGRVFTVTLLGACDLDDLLAHVAGCGRDRDQELVRSAIAEDLPELAGRPQHPNPVHSEVLLARVVVDETDRRVAERRVPQHLAQDDLGSVACPDDDHLLAARDEGARRRPLDQRSRKEAGAHDEREQDEQVDDPDATRNLGGMEVEQREDEKGCDDRGGHASQRAPHVPRRDISPPAVVEAEGEEDGEHDRDDEHDDVPLEVALVVDGRVAVEPHEERELPRDGDQSRVDDDLPEPVSVDGRSHLTTLDASGSRPAEPGSAEG